MAPKSGFLLLTILSIVLLWAPFGASRSGNIVGGWRPIRNPNDPEVVKIAQFAVAEHNREAKSTLSFVSVVRGETQVVSGTKYKLVIAARDGGDPKNYEAVVWYKPWQGFKQLLSFDKL